MAMSTCSNGVNGSSPGYPVMSPEIPTVPYLKILDQPVERIKYRFRGEITDTSSGGTHNNPKLKVEPCGWQIAGGKLFARLFTVDDVQPTPHINTLWGSKNFFLDQWTCTADLDRNGVATFKNLGVLRVRISDVATELIKLWMEQERQRGTYITETLMSELRIKAEQEKSCYIQKLQEVRIGFYGYTIDRVSGVHVPLDMVFSRPIFNIESHPELKVEESSVSSGPCTGGTRIWLRCTRKLRKNDLRIVFEDPKNGWRKEINVNEVYNQFLVILTSPPYKDLNIGSSVTVTIHLYRPSDSMSSEPVDFIYTPVRDEPSPKRQRLNVESPFDVSPGSYSGSGSGTNKGSDFSGAGGFQDYDIFDGAGNLDQYFNQYSPARASDTGSFEVVRPYSDDSSIGPGNTRVSNVNETAEQLQQTHIDKSILLSRGTALIEQFRNSGESGYASNRDSLPCDLVDSRPPSYTPHVSPVTEDEGKTESQPAEKPIPKILRFTKGELLQLTNPQLITVAMCLVDAQKEAVRNFSKEGDPVNFLEFIPRAIGSIDRRTGNSPLHDAVLCCQTSALHDLLKGLTSLPSDERLAIINLQNKKKQTALHIAVYRDQVESVHYLLSAGADRSKCDFDGNTVAHYLANTTNDEIYTEVLSPPSERAKSYPLDLKVVDNEGYSALHLAVMTIKISLSEALLEAGADINQHELKAGKKPLHLAVETGDAAIVYFLCSRKDVDVNARAYDNRTPLHIAVKNKQYAIASILMQAEADPECEMVDETASVETDPESEERGDNREMDTEESTEEPVRDPIVANAFTLTEGDERMAKILSGYKFDPDYTEFLDINRNARSEPSRQVPSKTPSSEALNEHSWINSAAGTSTSDRIHPDISQKRSLNIATRESPVPNDTDDVSSLDVVTRLRLSRLLDGNGVWEKLATALSCGHMIEMLRCVEDSSPTSLLLDQYEHLEGASISEIISALHKIGATEAEAEIKARRPLRRDYPSVSPKELDRASM